MARRPSPWYREERDEWRVMIRGVDRLLGKHPEGAARPRKSDRTGKWNVPEAIEREFRRLLDAPPEAPLSATQAEAETVAAVMTDFVRWGKQHLAPKTIGRYTELLENLVNFVDGKVQIGLLPVSELTPRHVTRWLDSRPKWGPTTRRNAIAVAQRALGWAVTNLGVERNPLAGMRKPQIKTRTQVVLPADFERILAHAHPRFRDLLVVSYDSGARPFEVKELEARHVDLDRHRAVIPATEAKGRRHPRTVYFPTERSLEVIRRLCAANPSGALFLNTRGNKWNNFSVANAFEEIQVAIGRDEMGRKRIESGVTDESVERFARTLKKTRRERVSGREVEKTEGELLLEARRKLVAAEAKRHVGRICHYSLRHSFVTRSLVAGVDSHSVAKLVGHRDTRMLDSTYSHVADDYEYMLEQARKAAEGAPRKKSEPGSPTHGA